MIWLRVPLSVLRIDRTGWLFLLSVGICRFDIRRLRRLYPLSVGVYRFDIRWLCRLYLLSVGIYRFDIRRLRRLYPLSVGMYRSDISRPCRLFLLSVGIYRSDIGRLCRLFLWSVGFYRSDIGRLCRLFLWSIGIYRSDIRDWICCISFRWPFYIFQIDYSGRRRSPAIFIVLLYLWPVYLQLAISQILSRFFVILNNNRLDRSPCNLLYIGSVGSRNVRRVPVLIGIRSIDHRRILYDRIVFSSVDIIMIDVGP